LKISFRTVGTQVEKLRPDFWAAFSGAVRSRAATATHRQALPSLHNASGDVLHHHFPNVVAFAMQHCPGGDSLGLGVLLKILDRPHQALRVDLPYRIPDFVGFGFTYPGWFCELHSLGFRLIRPIQDSCPPPQWRRNSNDELRGQLANLIRRLSASIRLMI
jgi:hypothetical protein